MPEITIDKDHIYYTDGVQITALSVTQVLNQWRLSQGWYINTDGTRIFRDTLDAASFFGTEIHKAASLILNKSGVDMDMINPDLLYCLEQYKEWHDRYMGEVLSIENPMYSERYGYCGSYDVICINKLTGRKMLVDFKTAAKTAMGHKIVGAQTAAYKQLYIENKHLKSNAQIDRYVLYLPKKTGRYSFNLLEGKNDWDYFRSALYCRAWLNNN